MCYLLTCFFYFPCSCVVSSREQRLLGDKYSSSMHSLILRHSLLKTLLSIEMHQHSLLAVGWFYCTCYRVETGEQFFIIRGSQRLWKTLIFLLQKLAAVLFLCGWSKPSPWLVLSVSLLNLSDPSWHCSSLRHQEPRKQEVSQYKNKLSQNEVIGWVDGCGCL